MIRLFAKFIIASLLFLSIVPSYGQEPNLDWTKKVGARKTPAKKKVYWVNNYGAVSDGKTVTTKAIQAAINDCATKGGGIVAFKPGQYLMGSIFIKSGVHLKVDKGVLILGSQDFAD